MSYRVSKVIKSITHTWRGRKIVVQIARRPVNQQRASDDIFAWHESPVATVPAVIAIVTQYKIVALGNNQLAIFHQSRHLFPPFRIDSVVGGLSMRKIVAIGIAQSGDVLHVRLLDRSAVNVDAFVDEAQAVSGQGYHSLHEVLRGVYRIMEDDDISAPDLAIGQKTVPAHAAAVAEFIHQQVIADQQRLLHGFRRDGERLHEKCDHKNGNHNRSRDRLHSPRPLPSGNLLTPRHKLNSQHNMVVILSAAKDLCISQPTTQVLRCAQDDRADLCRALEEHHTTSRRRPSPHLDALLPTRPPGAPKLAAPLPVRPVSWSPLVRARRTAPSPTRAILLLP